MFPIWLYIALLSHTTHVYSFTHRICNSADHNTCEGKTLTCNTNQDCFIECSGSAACRDTIIHCPTAKKCDIKCYYPPNTQPTDNSFICMRMTINATQSSQLILSASFGDLGAAPTDTKFYARTLEDATIYCPDNGRNAGIKSCKIYCDGDDLIRRAKIYAVEGLNDLYINSTAYHTGYCMRAATLYCKENFSASCPVTNTAPYGCQDYLHQSTDQTCEDYRIETGAPTTASPTMPTIFPTQSPTMEPTINTDSPTVNPTILASTFVTTLAPVLDEEKIGDDGKKNGLTTAQVVFYILLPVLAILCLCMGFFVFLAKKKSGSGHKHSSIGGKPFDEDEDDEDDEDEDEYDNIKTVIQYDSADLEEESKSESTVEIGMGVHKKGHSGIYEQAVDEDTDKYEMDDDVIHVHVQNGHAHKHKSSVSDESQSEY